MSINKEEVAFGRITDDSEAMGGGRPCIRVMRIQVSVIVQQIAHGATLSGSRRIRSKNARLCSGS
jgi:uncharacterized protein (DUF433 family)